MKKWLAVLLSLLFIVLSGVRANACNQNGMFNTSICTKYGFQYEEQVDSIGRIIRTYTCEGGTMFNSIFGVEQQVFDKDYSIDKTKKIISTLGMPEVFLNELTEADTRKYTNCISITGVTAYVKIDDQGNVKYISEEDAQAYASDVILPPHTGPDESGNHPAYATDYEDEYISLFYMIAYLGEGRYKFSVDATWLTDPAFRMKDSLGMCAQNFAIENNTRYGWYMYDVSMCAEGTYARQIDQKEEITDVYNAEGSGNWDGSAMIVDLKNDTALDWINYVNYSNHRMHYEFEATIHQYTVTTNFNATAAYDHCKLSIQLDPSISVSGSGASVSIGLSAEWSKERYLAEFDSSIQHTP